MNNIRITLIALVVAMTSGLCLAHENPSLAHVVKNEPRSQTLETALKAAGLFDTLKSDKKFTVLMPTEKAFARLPKGTLKMLLKPENVERLRTILSYHVIPQSLDVDALAKRRQVKTLAGPTIELDYDAAGQLRFNGSSRLRAINFLASNGYAHQIDRVLLPPEGSLWETAKSSKDFRTLVTAVKAAGLSEVLSEPGEYTVLAPTDAAFAKLGRQTIASLLRPENKAKLAAILKYHVIPGRVSAVEALKAGRAVPLLKKGSLRFGLTNGMLQVQGVNVVKNDLQASNGIIHVIDSVLLPPESLLPKRSGRKVLGLYLDTPGKALAAQLRLDRGKSSVISRLTEKGSAEKAGLERYDVILGFDKHSGTSKGLAAAKKNRDFGEPITVTLLRHGKKKTVKVPIGFAPH